MAAIESLLEAVAEPCKDARLNLMSVLRGTSLPVNQTWAVALTSALFLRDRPLAEALRADAGEALSPADVEDARAAASLMGMNTVYYRFRHLVGGPSYQQMKANLRMNRMASPATSKAQFELCSLACAALAGCEVCVQTHEQSLVAHGVTEAQVHDAVRVAAVVAGAVVALEAAPQRQAV